MICQIILIVIKLEVVVIALAALRYMERNETFLWDSV
jgi:hypothetical protein